MDKLLNTAIVCLGANTADSAERLAEAAIFLATLGTLGASSGKYPTAPEYAGESAPYLNEVITLSTALTYSDMQRRVKEYEGGVRARNKAVGLVNLDIDIVYWNGAVVRPKDAAAAYFRAGIEKIGLELYA